jgi:hypothetical protein
MAFAQLKEKERGFFSNINACLSCVATHVFSVRLLHAVSFQSNFVGK